MPFLLLLPRRNAVTPAVERLTALLCPYRGAVRRVDVAGGQLYASSLVELRAKGAVIPAGTRKNAQTAWAEITCDDDGVRIATDPLGTFPLWIAEDDSAVLVTSEVKSLRAIGFPIAFEPERWPANRKRPPQYSPYANVRRVLPGAALHIAPDLSIRQDGGPPLGYRPAAMIDGDAERKARLADALQASVREIAAGSGPWGSFVSGGIDSSVATALLARHHPKPCTYTLGTEHADEYAEAEDLARDLSTSHQRVVATPRDALAHFERAVFCNETIDGLTAETLAQLGVLQQAAAQRVRRIITGYGADLLFGSMLRHELYMKVTGVDDLQSLIERTCWSGEFSPFYAWSLGVEVHHAFWDPRVMNCAFQIPPEASFDGTREKVLLRTMAVEAGYLREEHAFRKKQALTDGTQFNRLLSQVLELGDAYSYDGKSARAIALLRGALRGRSA